MHCILQINVSPLRRTQSKILLFFFLFLEIILIRLYFHLSWRHLYYKSEPLPWRMHEQNARRSLSVSDPNNPIDCCTPDRWVLPECYSIAVPEGDDFFGVLGQTCLNVPRSAPCSCKLGEFLSSRDDATKHACVHPTTSLSSIYRDVWAYSSSTLLSDSPRPPTHYFASKLAVLLQNFCDASPLQTWSRRRVSSTRWSRRNDEGTFGNTQTTRIYLLLHAYA